MKQLGLSFRTLNRHQKYLCQLSEEGKKVYCGDFNIADKNDVALETCLKKNIMMNKTLFSNKNTLKFIRN